MRRSRNPNQILTVRGAAALPRAAPRSIMFQVTRLAKSAALAAAAAFTLMAWVDKDAASVIARRNWWAFRAPAKPAVPEVSGGWVRTPIDAFVLDGLRSKK